MGAEEPAAVTIASAQQAAVFADNVQYQFRTENSSGQVSMIFPLLWWGGRVLQGSGRDRGKPWTPNVSILCPLGRSLIFCEHFLDYSFFPPLLICFASN